MKTQDGLSHRRRRATPCIAIAILAIGFAGCAHVPKDFGASEVQASTRERVNTKIEFGGAENGSDVRALLDKPLTPDSAVQIALLRNPDVAIIFAELGVSRAELIEAGTLPNPSLSAMVRLGVGSASGAMNEFNGAFPLLDAIMLPLRKKVETQNFEQAKLRAADRLLALVAEVRTAWYEAVAAQQERDIVTTSLEAASTAAELARRQYDAGNLSRLELLSNQTLEVQTRLEVRELEAAAAAKEQELRRVLGLQTNDEWMLMSVLPAATSVSIDAGAIESAATEKRLDLAAADHRVASMEKGLQLARRFRFTGPTAVGVSADHEPGGDWFVGPSLDIELPIFNQKRGNVMRFSSLVDLARADREALQNRARAEVRTAASALQSAVDRANAYDTELLPLRRDLLKETQLHYNGMLVGVYDLLNAKRMELDAERGSVRARLDYWHARIALERAIAGPIPAGAKTPPTESAPVASPPAETAHEHHHEKE